jgi:hypothetical protein
MLRDRAGEHPQVHLANYNGILQSNADSGYTQLYLPDRSPGPLYEAACWAHARAPFFTLPIWIGCAERGVGEG